MSSIDYVIHSPLSCVSRFFPFHPFTLPKGLAHTWLLSNAPPIYNYLPKLSPTYPGHFRL